MSAVASFTKIPKAALAGLRESVQNRSIHAYLKANGREIAEYRWSGYVLATLLPYLQETFQINLMNSEYDELNALLTDATGATHFIFSPAQKRAFLSRLGPDLFSEDELGRYFNEFNATNEQGMGRAMLDGVTVFRESLLQIDDDTVVVFSIG